MWIRIIHCLNINKSLLMFCPSSVGIFESRWLLLLVGWFGWLACWLGWLARPTRIRGPRFGIFQPRQSAGRNSGHSCRDITDSGPSCRDIPIPTQFQARIRGPSFVIFQPRISAGRNSAHSCRDIGSSCRDIHEQLFVIVCDWTPIKYCAGID